MLDPRQPVAQIVLDHSECAEVFQRYRIDFCCHGEQSLEAAARGRQVELAQLVADLARAIEARKGAPLDDPAALPTPHLVAYIVKTHHAYLRKALPFVRGLAAKVARVHGDKAPKLRELDAAVQGLADALLPHLDEEEQVLFPLLVATPPDRQRIAASLGAMLEDHLAVAALLERIRAASDDFTLPDWACNSYRTLFAELRALESDTFRHVHLENHALLPRFAAA